MELPIVQTSYQPSADALIRAAKRAELILARTLAQEIQQEAATLFINPQRPHVALANSAMEVSLPDTADAHALVHQILKPYEQANTACARLQNAVTEWPKALTHAMAQRGYEPKPRSIYLLTRSDCPEPTNSVLQIIPARAAYGQLTEWYRSIADRGVFGDGGLADEYASTGVDLLDEPRMELFLGRIDGKPVGTAGMVTLGQIGVLYGLTALPLHPQQVQIEQTLLTHVIDHCARAQFSHVIVDLPEQSQSDHIYRKIGFEPVASYTTYDHGSTSS